jgi:UDP-N-acetylmuramoylalanine--D-glutamate ligase
MSIEQLAKQSRDRLHGSLATVDTALLRRMRDTTLRDCFRRLDETSHRMEPVATIHGKQYIDDTAARSVNATLYSLQNTSGPIVWIALGGDDTADYHPLLPIALRKVSMLVCVGSRNGALHSWFDPILPTVVDADDIATALALARRHPGQKSRIVFSPATPQGGATALIAQQFVQQVNEI